MNNVCKHFKLYKYIKKASAIKDIFTYIFTFLGYLFIVGGYEYSSSSSTYTYKTEVVDLEDDAKTPCAKQHYAYPAVSSNYLYLRGLSGGVLNGTLPIVCGGVCDGTKCGSSTDDKQRKECYLFNDDNTWSQFVVMNYYRHLHASVVINNGSTLWLTGKKF